MMRPILMALFLVLMLPQGADAAPDTVTICHANGNGSFITLTIPRQAAFGQAGHFNENGTTTDGHEDDYLGPCLPSDTTTTSTTTTTSSTTTTTSTTSVPSSSSSTTLPPSDSSSTTSVPCVGICGPATVSTTTPPDPQACLQHRINGPELAEGDYVEYPSLEDEGVTGTTRWGIMPCGPIPDDTTTTEPVTTSTIAAGGTGTTVALSSVAGLLTLLGLGATRFARR